jgi:molybdate transport system substrate-binding protein
LLAINRSTDFRYIYFDTPFLPRFNMPTRSLHAAVLVAALAGAPAWAAELTVSAAASLTNAFREVGTAFESGHPGHQVRFNFAASGALLQQIAKGAPVDVFASADQETMDQAQAQSLVQATARRNFVANSLVVIVPQGAKAWPMALGDLAQPAWQRIAIGLPASVPVGRYTQGVLQAARLWTAIEPKMIGAQNVRQALDYVKVKVALTVSTATPILYPAAPVATSPNKALAQAFVDHLLSPGAQAVFARHGFGRP